MKQILRYLIIAAVVCLGIGLVVSVVSIAFAIFIPVLLIGIALYFGLKLYYRSPWLQNLFTKSKKKGASSATYYEMDQKGNIIAEHEQIVTIIEPEKNKR